MEKENHYNEVIFDNEDMATIYYAMQAYRLHNVVMHYPIPHKKRFNYLLKQVRHPSADFDVSVVDTRLFVKSLHYVQNYTDEFEYMCKVSNLSKKEIKKSLDILPKLTKKVEKYAGECIQNTSNPIEIQQRLSKDIRFAKHGFVREALDNIFKNLSIDSNSSTRFPYDMISAVALGINNHQPLGEDTEFFILKSVILGTKHFLNTCNSNDPEIPDQVDMLDDFEDKQRKHLKYVLCFDEDDGSTKITKVDKKNCIIFIQKIKDYLKSITVPTDKR